jgi:hypothetical protein
MKAEHESSDRGREVGYQTSQQFFTAREAMNGTQHPVLEEVVAEW